MPTIPAPAGRYATLPKAELHLHIEGTLEPEAAFRMAARNGVRLPYADVEELRARYAFTDLVSFLDVYYECMAALRTEEDFAELCETYLRTAVGQGVRHVEMFFDPQAHTSRGVPVDTVIDGLLAGFARVAAREDLTGGLILCFLRDRPVAEAAETLESVRHRASDLIGVGLDSAEVGFPPSLFEGVFAAARALGLHVVAHAGEEGPVKYIEQALDLLHVERIDHGVRCMESPAMVARLRAERIPLTVCPLSNLRLGVVSDLADHPLPAMLGEDLLVTINSDDPAYFGGYVADNFAAVAGALGLDEEQLELVARNSINASFAPAGRKAQLLAGIDAWAAARS
ncbi:adenine deaminase [Zafaria cholistanensis]|uniref:Adenine deaminase n=1 Tax=Zafaria cholistanensis TaxID=1682741 RepID=A0A5A7NM64_9MICC|nr:adenosine deaminase [Zafaria cholistanensis]GER21995.1 adenine deaminase [Zafaria cholistanensis]